MCLVVVGKVLSKRAERSGEVYEVLVNLLKNK